MSSGGVARPLSLYLGIPAYGGIDPAFVRSLVVTCLVLKEAGIPFEMEFLYNCSRITRARNDLAAKFMASEYDALMFLDCDLEFNAEDLVRMSQRPEALIGGVYRTKEAHRTHYVCNPILPIEKVDGVVECKTIATGFMRIKREVFETLKPNAAPFGDKFAYFTEGVRDGTDWGEDYSFCRDYREAGGKVWLYPCNIKHCGRYEYSGDVDKWLNC